jgi:heparan-alpha-glucosaminide N-acetyltransferase
MELQVASPAIAAKTGLRVMSIDVLRGLVMFTMVAVNDTYGTRGTPWWFKHWGDLPKSFGPSGMTVIDIVFPAFLFIVGMSIPVALENRRSKGDSWLKIYGHVLLRTVSLLFLGVLMVEDPSDRAIGWRPGVWSALMYGGAILAFLSLPLKNRTAKYISWGVRAAGIGLLIFLAFKFRNEKGGRIEPTWWGILGLIGWAYFGASTIYLLLRNEGIPMLIATVALLMCVYFADSAGSFRHIQSWHVHLFDHKYAVGSWIAIGEAFGSQTAITMAGVVLGSLLLATGSIQSPASKIRFALVFAILMSIGGLLLVRTFGISKNNATPTWCLWSAAITTMLWIPLFWLIDVRGFRAWSIPLAWAGASALMIYILSDLWEVLIENWVHWGWYDRLGETFPTAIYHKLLTAAGLSLIAAVLARIGLKLKL